MTIKKEECLDLPPLIKERIFVEMSLDQERHYEEMRRDFITFVGSEACTAELVITKGLRLMQIVSGFMGMEQGKIKEFKDTPREKMLEDLLIEHADKLKIIVWAVWIQNYETIKRVCGKLRIPYVECHGAISQKNKNEAVREFNEGSARVFIGNPASLGVGINLVSSAMSIYYSRNFTLENDIQSEGRNYRSGSEIHEKIVRLDIVTLNTIDEIVLEALANKQKVGDKILRKNLSKI